MEIFSAPVTYITHITEIYITGYCRSCQNTPLFFQDFSRGRLLGQLGAFLSSTDKSKGFEKKFDGYLHSDTSKCFHRYNFCDLLVKGRSTDSKVRSYEKFYIQIQSTKMQRHWSFTICFSRFFTKKFFLPTSPFIW